MKTGASSQIRLALVDDHQIVIDGLKLLLNGENKFSIIAESNSAAEMFNLLQKNIPDVLITDILMAGMDGYELCTKIKNSGAGIKILALSMSGDGAMITKMIDEVKVEGYIPKTSGKNELVKAIECVAGGKTYYSAEILEQYKFYKKIKDSNLIFNLTSRELEIIQCITQHLSNKEIADKLFISERTVETHRKNIYRKTNTKGEASLMQFASQHNLLS